jgi:indolepyruvate ferredoxin oxidoreductase
LDLFGYSGERQRERKLLADYEETLKIVQGNLSAENYERAVALARWPETVRGFGHVKDAAIEHAEADASARRAAFLADAPDLAQAAE